MMTKHHPTRPPHSQTGATLIEVLVSILLMALGVMAMAAMQVSAVQYSKTSEFRTIATLLANDLGDRMRANHPATQDMAAGYDYLASGSYAAPSLPGMPNTDCADGTTQCAFNDMAAFDRAQWARHVFQQLPQGTARVKVTGANADVWIIWTDPNSNAGQAADDCPTGYGQPANVRCIYFRITI